MNWTYFVHCTISLTLCDRVLYTFTKASAVEDTLRKHNLQDTHCTVYILSKLKILISLTLISVVRLPEVLTALELCVSLMHWSIQDQAAVSNRLISLIFYCGSLRGVGVSMFPPNTAIQSLFWSKKGSCCTSCSHSHQSTMRKFRKFFVRILNYVS